MIGKTISHYRILDKLGEGGMGVVYKAEDTKLQRTVALKFLLPQALEGEEDKTRFVNEARAAAGLGHSNICTVHEIDEAEGQTFVAMEYVEGESLKDRIKSGPLRLDDAIDTAIQIAEGLHEAHQKGIVHRDIKPANIMVTSKGQVRITDFGLAKSAKRTMLTKSGTTLGTVAYMSPEQARGEAVDARTDIWSLGVVLYEMISGQRAFKGEYEQAVVYSILNQVPEPLTAVRTGVPMELERIVAKAMAKKPGERYQHIDELPVHLRALQGRMGVSTVSAASPNTGAAGGVGGAAGPVMGAAAPAMGTARRHGLRVRALALAFGGLVVGALAAGFGVWGLMRSRPSVPQPVTRFVIPLPEDHEIGKASPALAISPDGTRLAYVADSGEGDASLYLRRLDRIEAEMVPWTEGAGDPFFSPDSRWLGFFADGKLKKVSVAGGAPLTICQASYVGMGACWGKDDTIVFPASESSGLMWVSADGGIGKVLTRPDFDNDQICHRRPHVLPDGKNVIFTALTGEGPELVVMNLRTRKWRTILSDVAEARYVDAGYLVYARSGALHAVPFDLSNLKVTGSSIPIAAGVYSRMFYGLDLTYFAVSNTGALVYAPGSEAADRNTLVWVDRDGEMTPLTEDKGDFRSPRVSPDGRRVAVTSVADDGRMDIWIYDVERGTRTRLTSKGNNLLPVWTPDGERVTFASNRAGPLDMYWQAADGGGETELLLARERSQFPMSWSPDGRVLAFTEMSPDAHGDILMLDAGGDGSPTTYVSTPLYDRSPRFSPDGRWVAYASDESGRFEVYVKEYPGPGGRWSVSTDGGRAPVWSPDGLEIFYRKGDCLMVVPVETEPEFKAGKPRALFEGQLEATPAHIHDFDISRDGRRFVMVRSSDKWALTELHVVLNWLGDADALASEKAEP